MTQFKLKCKKKHNVLLSLTPSEGSTTELFCSLTNYWGFLPILPPHGVAKCLGVLYTTQAFPLPLGYQSTLVISTTWVSWMRLETPLPGTQPPWVLQAPLTMPQNTAPGLPIHWTRPPANRLLLLGLWDTSFPSPTVSTLTTGIPKKLGMLRKGEEEALTSSSFCFLVLQKPLRQKILGGSSYLIKIQKKKLVSKQNSKQCSASLSQIMLPLAPWCYHIKFF